MLKLDSYTSASVVIETARQVDSSKIIVPLECRIRSIQLRYFGHIQRKPQEDRVRLVCAAQRCERSKPGKPFSSFRSSILSACQLFNLTPANCVELATNDKTRWKHILKDGMSIAVDNWMAIRRSQENERHADRAQDQYITQDCISVIGEEQEEEADDPRPYVDMEPYYYEPGIWMQSELIELVPVGEQEMQDSSPTFAEERSRYQGFNSRRDRRWREAINVNSLEKFAQEVAPAFALTMATSEFVRSNGESFLNLELSNTAATSAEVNLQIS